MKRNYLVLVFIAGTILTSTSVAQKKTAVAQQFNIKVDLKKVGTGAQKIAGIDSLLQSFVDQKKVANVTAFVAKGGNVVYKKSFGWKDMEKGIPATPEDYYIIFSQTKAITTVAFMTLVEKGLVKIYDPVSKYFPEIPDKIVTAVHNDGT
jgi:CubicO group peptidase (beta-lactamase class C family)